MNLGNDEKMGFVDEEKRSLIRKAIHCILIAKVGPRWEKDENFRDTPNRFFSFLEEAWTSDEKKKEELGTCSPIVFPTKNKKMIISPYIRVFSLCPHHLLPVEYDITIAYMPKEIKGKISVLGASKLTRIAQILGRDAIMQEDLIDRIVETIHQMISIEGIAILTTGTHMCMRCRGIKSNSPYIVPYMEGCFRDNDKVREEFYQAIQHKKER